MADQSFRVKNGLEVGIGATVLTALSTGNIGIGITNPQFPLDIVGNIRVIGEVTASSFGGVATYATIAGYSTSSGVSTSSGYATIAGYSTSSGISTQATKLQNLRTFEITGDIVGAAVTFDGTGNVSIAATIQPNSVGLGTDTTGDYVQSITGTSNQISVSVTSGEGSTPILSLPSNLVIPQDATVTRDLQVNRNLNVTGNITLGGTTAFINVQELVVSDPDIILGYRTDAFGNNISNDTTANHGGVALASTEGTPLVQLFIAGIETNPATYKKIMWFKSGAFAGLNTDAWLSNYAVGIGSTQFPSGTRLAAGAVQFTEIDLAVVRNINASGIITATSFNGNGASLTSLNASNLGSGTIPDARFPATLPAVSGANLTAINASNLGSGTIPDARFPATLPAVSGANLTAINASNLGSGTIPDARFPATLPAISGANLTGIPGGFPSGTLMLFQQTSAPTGWTKQTTHNDKALRVVSGSASSGGSTAFTSVFASRTPAGTVDNTTLTTAQIPSHTHSYTASNNQNTRIVPSTNGAHPFLNQGTFAATTGAEGSGGAHNHGFTGTAMDFAVQYVDLIIASKV